MTGSRLTSADDGLEGGAPASDDRRAQRRDRDARGGEPLAGLAAASQVRRRVSVVHRPEAAEVDDLRHARRAPASLATFSAAARSLRSKSRRPSECTR